MTSSSEPLTQVCTYREAGAFCSEGFLYRYDGVGQYSAVPVKVEDQPLQCPKCEGKGHQLTSAGRQLLLFLNVFARPMLRDLVDELFEERQHN